jgi:type VI secretion system protein ImpG
MDKLLPYYERELALLQREAEDFAQRHPHIAGRLSASGELLQDPQVQRLLQAFAWLGARVHARLDDDFPRLSHALLEQLSPQWLRPFPACSIAHFHNPEAAAARSTAGELPPGTRLDSIPLHQSEPLRFATTAPVQLLPLHVAWAGMTSLAQVPARTLLPHRTAALFSVRLELLSTQACWGRLGVEHIRLFLDGEAPLVALLRETLTSRVLATLVQTAAQGPWRADATACPRPVGLAPGEALIADGWPAAHRLLAEYFNFPAKFDFIDLPLPLVARQAQGSTLVLHFALAGLRGDGREAQALEQAGARHLRPGCVPVINLFDAAAEAEAAKQQPGRYTVRAHAHAEMHELHAITRVQYRRPGDGEDAAGLREVEAFHSLQRNVPPDEALYWITRCDEAAARRGPAHEVPLELVDAAQAPSGAAVAALEVQARFTHGELPSRMSIGRVGGDLVPADGGWSGIWLLRPPTPSRRFDFSGDRAWQLQSQLRPRHLLLSGPGLEAFRAGLRLFDWTGDAATARLLDGLAGIELHPAQACMAGPSGPGLVRGSEIRLRVREAAFAERGLHLFAQVLSPCFALQVHANSFTQLRLVSADTGETLAEGPRCRGELPLL